MLTTCDIHGKGNYIGDIKRHRLDSIIKKLPRCYAGYGKGKCAYCAYETGVKTGYEKAIKELKSDLDTMKLNKVIYDELSSKQQETFLYHKAASVLADYGFNCIALSDDWHGADCLAYHKDDGRILKIQLKGRMTIAKKYIDKDVHLCFPVDSVWHLVLHDQLLCIVEETTPSTLETKSWIEGGEYSWRDPSKVFRQRLSQYALGPA